MIRISALLEMAQKLDAAGEYGLADIAHDAAVTHLMSTDTDQMALKVKEFRDRLRAYMREREANRPVNPMAREVFVEASEVA